jgi:hypothetical protein
MQKTLIGPRGYKLILDTAEVFPNDPGAGTPAMVTTPDGAHTATFWCAMDCGELYGPRGTLNVPEDVFRWLSSQEADVDAYLYP